MYFIMPTWVNRLGLPLLPIILSFGYPVSRKEIKKRIIFTQDLEDSGSVLSENIYDVKVAAYYSTLIFGLSRLVC